MNKLKLERLRERFSEELQPDLSEISDRAILDQTQETYLILLAALKNKVLKNCYQQGELRTLSQAVKDTGGMAIALRKKMIFEQLLSDIEGKE